MRIFESHVESEINLDGEKVNIDSKLVGVIKRLNELGIKTYGCCQGTEKRDSGYIILADDMTVGDYVKACMIVSCHFQTAKVILDPNFMDYAENYHYVMSSGGNMDARIIIRILWDKKCERNYWKNFETSRNSCIYYGFEKSFTKQIK